VAALGEAALRGGLHAERALGHVIAGVRGVYDWNDHHAQKRAAFEALPVRFDV
jgi:hypothetical protein